MSQRCQHARWARTPTWSHTDSPLITYTCRSQTNCLSVKSHWDSPPFPSACRLSRKTGSSVCYFFSAVECGFLLDLPSCQSRPSGCVAQTALWLTAVLTTLEKKHKKKKTTRNVWKTFEFKVTSLTRTGAVCQAYFPSDFQDLKGRGCNLWMDSATCSASWREASALYFFKGFMHTSLCLQYCFPGPSCINTDSDYWPLYIFFCRHTSLI